MTPPAYRAHGRGGRGGVLAAALVAAGYLLVTRGGLLSAASGTVTSSSVSANVALGQRMAAAEGWTGVQWTCLNELWTRESGWSATAANPTSDARGIPQNISGWSASYPYGQAEPQISWGIAYISGRYGTPCAAWSFETSHTPNWY